jgi:hypothetical protein
MRVSGFRIRTIVRNQNAQWCAIDNGITKLDKRKNAAKFGVGMGKIYGPSWN